MALTESEHDTRVNALTLQVHEVSKVYQYSGNNNRSSGPVCSHVVLNNVSIDVCEGEFVTIVGPSGCGKSTLLNIIAGLDSPDSGNVFMRGEVKSNTTDPNRIVIFQEGALFPWLTVFENIEFGLKVAKIPIEERKKTANRFIEMVQLSRFADSYVHQLSGGMKQRVAIARALALNPDILLMDEPFAALDVQTRDLLHAQLLKIHEATKKTILFVTHNINEAIMLGSRLVVMSPASGGIKKEFVIKDMPRPRDIDSPEVAAFKRQILKELEEDFQFARKDSSSPAKQAA